MRLAVAMLRALGPAAAGLIGIGTALAQGAGTAAPAVPAATMHPLCERHAGAQWRWDVLLDCGVVDTRRVGPGGDGAPGRGGRLASYDELEAALATAELLLIGEIHDNRSQAAGKARLIIDRARAARGARPAVVLEHFRADQQPAIDRYLARHRDGWKSHRRAGDRASRRSAVAQTLLRDVLEWEKSGWPDDELFVPSIEAALGGGLPILAGDPPGGVARAVARGGMGVLSAAERTRLGLDRPLPPALLAALAAELKEGHCGLLPERALVGMADAQRYRDAHLAAAMAAGYRTHKSAILLAGNGHVRLDRGVPWHLRQQLPKARILSVMLVEVADGRTEPLGYVPRDPDGRPAADFVVLTLRQPRPDPCEAMRRHMQKKE